MGDTDQFLDRLEKAAIAQAPDGVLAPRTSEWFAWARKMFDRRDPLSYVVDSLIAYNEQIDEWNYRDDLGLPT